MTRNVRAFTTTRNGGSSTGSYTSLNLAGHVGDEPAHVQLNREAVRIQHGLPATPRWIEQVHGVATVDLAEVEGTDTCVADAAYTNTPNRICAILSADCLPILLRDHRGEEVAAIHAGWRGLLNGIVESAVAKFRAPDSRLVAWLGPGIARQAYAVDKEFRARFLDQGAADPTAFRQIDGRWHASLRAIAEYRLRRTGISNISAYTGCTYAERERFFSYRRDGATGRMASLIWLDSNA